MKLEKHFFPHDGILSQKGLCKLVWEGAWQCLPLLMKTILRKGLSLTFRVMHRVTRSFLSALQSRNRWRVQVLLPGLPLHVKKWI